MKIIDASVAFKWFVHEPSGQQAADDILTEVEGNPRLFGVPDLFFAEMLHILCRFFQDEKKVKESLSILENLGFARIGLGHDLLQTAATLALKHKISGYDAIYVATAQMMEGHWYTFDQEAHKKIRDLKVSVVLR